ncbi:hypothetical protein CT19431_U20016 [Cupriavidus taiwanensis]|nr:hypothetical protein CT19431_U20016 [Cupriavidus taiwanensis]
MPLEHTPLAQLHDQQGLGRVLHGERPGRDEASARYRPDNGPAT